LKILEDLRQYGLPIKTMPSLWSILSGRSPMTALKAIEPEDILFRAPALNGSTGLTELLQGKRVMVTGAGGSIGSELCKQIAAFSPEQLILYECHEENLYRIEKCLQSSDTPPLTLITPIIGDILDGHRVHGVMEEYRPHIIFHAAAYKHVPMIESNPQESFRTNVIGTRTIAEKALEFDVERFVLISTDKAVNPISVMGMTKKIAEEIIQYFAQSGRDRRTKFITVRFGNVLESSGSVVPLFKEQISKGGPVTVTHPEMTRYLMTISEAVRLVLQAAALGSGGETFVLDMGKAVKILDLAKRMISLYRYKPGIDIDIAFTGLRPGEKMDEELFNDYEKVENTSHPQINRANANGMRAKNILGLVSNYEDASIHGFHINRETLGRLVRSLPGQ
jgi:FlaA1/EpsC-like NDP-sugar epimerase